MKGIWALLALWLCNSARASEGPASATGHVRWSVETGFPWTGAHVRSDHSKIAWSAGAETALFRRWEAYAGIETHLLYHSCHKIRLGSTAGWVRQVGILGRQGPQVSMRLEWEWDGQKRLVPRVLLIEKAFWASSTEEPDYQGLEDSISLLTPLHGRVVHAGLGLSVGEEWILEPAIRLGLVDGQFAIPAISIVLRNRMTPSSSPQEWQ